MEFKSFGKIWKCDEEGLKICNVFVYFDWLGAYLPPLTLFTNTAQALHLPIVCSLHNL
jgi:hypothetical protein